MKGVNEYTDMLVYSGKMEPDFTGGLTTRLRWKGLTFGANFSLLLGAGGKNREMKHTLTFRECTPVGLPIIGDYKTIGHTTCTRCGENQISW